jgi:hypothetical protein
MYVLPYILSKSKGKGKLVWLFLERNGTHLMEQDASQVDQFLEENDLIGGTRTESGGVLYIEINAATEGLANFYTWGEVQPGSIPAKEVWRSFLWLDESEELWGVNKQLEKIILSPSQTAYSVLNPLCSV